MAPPVELVVAGIMAMFLATSLVQSLDVDMQIYFVNDIKYDIFPVKHDNTTDCASGEVGCFGGLLRLKYVVEQSAVTPTSNTTLWLNTGHVLDGDAFDVLKFDVATAITNLDFQALALDVEMFRYGVEPAAAYFEFVKSQALAANVKKGLDGVARSKLIAVAESNCSVVLIGFINKQAMEAMKLHGVDIEEEKKAIEDEIAAVKSSHNTTGHVFVALGSASVETATLLAGIADVDIVLFSGANFTGQGDASVLYFQGVNASVGEGVVKTNYVASVVKNFVELDKRFLIGSLQVFLDNETCKLTSPPKHVVADYLNVLESTDQSLEQFMQAELKTWNGLNSTLAKSKVNLLPTDDSCKVGECSLGNLIADAIVEKLNDLTPEKPWDDSIKLAIFPAALIQNRNKVNVTGNITSKQLYKLFAEDEYIYTVKISGKLLKKMFEESLKKKDEKLPVMENFLQVSASLRVEYELEHSVVTRIQTMCDDLLLSDVELDDDVKKFVVGVPRSMISGDGVYAEMLKDSEPTFYNATVVEALREQVTQGGGSLTPTPISTRLTSTVHLDLPTCHTNVAEVVILTLVCVVVLVVGVLVVWKFLWPRYRQRRGFDEL